MATTLSWSLWGFSGAGPLLALHKVPPSCTLKLPMQGALPFCLGRGLGQHVCSESITLNTTASLLVMLYLACPVFKMILS